MGFKNTEIKGKLIGKQIAIFYLADFDAKANLPSIVFEKEPTTIGEIHSGWKMFLLFTIWGKRLMRHFRSKKV